MGFFTRLKSATTLTLATQFVRKHLEVQRDLGSFHGDVADTASRLVTAVWQEVSEAAQEAKQPNPALLGAAAHANGASHFDTAGNTALADTLIGALKTLLQYDVHKLVDSERLGPIDRLLWDMAHRPFEVKPVRHPPG
jgi:hypothetical protein